MLSESDNSLAYDFEKLKREEGRQGNRVYGKVKDFYGEPLDDFKTESGAWELFKRDVTIKRLKEENKNIESFVAFYKQNREPITLFKGEQYDESEVKETLEILTDNFLERTERGKLPFKFGEAESRKLSEKSDRYFILAGTAYLLGTLGSEFFGYPFLEDFQSSATEFIFNLDLHWKVALAASPLLFPVAWDIGKKGLVEFGKFLDEVRVADLPDKAKSYSYGEKAYSKIKKEESDIEKGEKKVKIYPRIKERLDDLGCEEFEDILEEIGTGWIMKSETELLEEIKYYRG